MTASQPPWGADRGCGRGERLRPVRSHDADIRWSSKIEHPIEDVSGDRHLGRLAFLRARTECATHHLLPPMLLLGSGVMVAHHTTRAATSAPSRAVPRRRALGTN